MRAVTKPALVVAVTLLIGADPPRAAADWSPSGLPVCTAATTQVHAVLASDGADGAIVAWQDFRFPRVNVFAQHVLTSGEVDPAWPANGRALLNDPAAIANADGGQTVPQIVPDGSGGAIVAWQDLRTGANDIDLFAQHIQASGAVDPAWPANGTALVALAGVQKTMAMVPDGDGGAIVAWADSRAAIAVFQIFAQHVLASGVVDPRWPANGLAITASGPQELPAITTDGSGGAIIAWGGQPSGSADQDVYAQRILNSGLVAPGWPVNGRALCTAAGGQGRATIVPDGAHGAIVAWTDGRLVESVHIFATHVLGSGAVDPTWPVDGRRLSDAGVLESRPLAVPDGEGGAVVTWQAFTVHINMYAQHVIATGVVDPAWPAGGRALSLSDRDGTFADIASDGAGGAIVAWDENDDVMVQHVLRSGALDPDYPANGRPVVSVASSQADVALIATGGGGAIAAWTDNRNADLDIFALQVLDAGTTGVPGGAPGEIAFLRPSPIPARGVVTLRFTLSRAAAVRLAIYDASGRRVRELTAGTEAAGDHAVGWDLRDGQGRAVGAGLYFARLEADGRQLTQKLAALE